MPDPRPTRRRSRSFIPEMATNAALLERRDLPTTLPTGFTESLFALGLSGPTAMDVAPDGRIFVAEKRGLIRVVSADGRVLDQPFASVAVDQAGERGLTGIVLDPDFAQNGYVYAYFITPNLRRAPAHALIQRFTAVGNVASPEGPVTILSLPKLNSKHNFHVAGALHFGPDGKLYVSVGDDEDGRNSQSLGTPLGKILRINKDGTIPADNPFYRRAKGVNRAIWALGLRNPFTFAFSPGDGRMFINDVGLAKWEEIDEGRPGGNYGWPKAEGRSKLKGYLNPVFTYPHGDGDLAGRAVTGGVFYRPARSTFPSEYVGGYFFADFVNQWIRRYDPATGIVTPFATGLINKAIDLDVDAQGNLDYLSIDAGAIYRIIYAPDQPPTLAHPPESTLVSVGQAATFNVGPAGTSPFAYQWSRNGVDIPGAVDATLTLPSPTLADDGSTYRVRISNAFGTLLSDPAALRVTTAHAPLAAIVTPAEGARSAIGRTVGFSGVAFDDRDGDLPASAFTWTIELHHDGHFHPYQGPLVGIQAGSFVIPPHADPGTFSMRITLTVVNSAGLKTKVVRELSLKK